MRALLSAAIAVAIAATPQLSLAANTLDCDFASAMHDVDVYGRVPSAIRAMIGNVAERGAPFEATDSIRPGDRLSSMRLLRAGYRGDNWFVWWERGGIAHIWQAAVFRMEGDRARVLGAMNIPIAWRNDQWTPTTDVCALIEGVLAGKYPPYPPGISGAALL